MTVNAYVLKLTHNESNVKITSTAAGDNYTITLGTDLVIPLIETPGTPEVAIDKMMWTVSPVAASYVKIERGATLICNLHATGEMDLNSRGITDDAGYTSDIKVTFVGGSGGVIYLKLKKRAGYGD